MNFSVHPPLLVRTMFPRLLWKVRTKENAIYLTFDDGPIPELTPWVLSELQQFNAKATFFCVADNVRKYPEIFEKIRNDGHSVGNHTYNHLNGWKNSKADYIANASKANELINSKLFRPPYGLIKESQKRLLLKHYQIVMWDVLSRDFDQKITPDECWQNVKRFTKQGSIVVFHDNIKAENNLKYALPKMLEYYTEKGFRFESLKSTSGYK